MDSPYSNRPVVPKGYRPFGMAQVSPRKRPSMSPREYQAWLDRLNVQDCLWARMKPSEIARHLGKDKAWVSRTIQRLEKERETVYRSPKAAELIEENMGQLDSLLARAYAAMRRDSTAKGQLSAIRTAADVLRQKAEYQMAVGLVQRRERAENGGEESQDEALMEYVQEHLPLGAVTAIIEKLALSEEERKQEQEKRQAKARAGAN